MSEANTHLPTISEASVSAVLKGMRQTSRKTRYHALEHLAVVDYLLAHPDMPPGMLSTEYALHTLLTDLITEEYSRERRIAGIPLSAHSDPKAAVIENLTRDGASSQRELIGWSCLYHLFVCVEPRLTQTEIADHLNLDARTVRRYQRQALRQLTRLLYKKEHEARGLRRNRLMGLTLQPNTPFVGRNTQRKAVRDLFNHPSLGRRHIYVMGESGIGKTAFVKQCLREQIQVEKLMCLVWVYQPTSVDAVHDQLTAQLLRPGLPISLAEFVALYPTGVVIDGVDNLRGTPRELQDLLETLDAAAVFLIDALPVVLETPLTTLRLEPLDYNETMRVIAQIAPDFGADERALIWAQSGGNPRRIHHLAASLR